MVRKFVGYFLRLNSNQFCQGLGSVITTSNILIPSLAKPIGCTRILSFYNTNGAYTKTACIHTANVNYEGNLAACKAMNMNLFIIETAEDLTQLLALGTSFYGPNHFLRVNGQLAANGTWFVNPNTTDVKPLFSGAIPTNITGSCLVFTSELVPTRTKSIDCSFITHAFCEFI